MLYSKVIIIIITMCLLLSCRSEAKNSIPEEPTIPENIDTVAEKVEGISAQEIGEEASQDPNEVIDDNEVLTDVKKPIESNESTQVEQSEVVDDVGQIIETGTDPAENIEEENATEENSNLEAEQDEVVSENEPIVIEEKEPAQEIPSDGDQTNIEPTIGIHDTWNTLLSKYVSGSGTVDYKGLKSQESRLDLYLESLNSHVSESKSKSKEDMTFWMNAYNAFTIKLILKNYPLGSIRDLDGGNPWDVKWIQLGGKTYSLNNIEHDILRPTFKDPRIHFAVNCAAKSCPKLGNAAFAAESLESQLESLTKSFVNNKTVNSVSSNALELSKIFEWYSEDFGDLRKFISKYSSVEVNPSASISYRDYNWSLNGK